MQKFTCLQSAVSGTTADLFKGMAITEVNYKTTVDILKKCFGDEQIQRTALLHELNNFPCTDNKYHELRHLVGTTSSFDSYSLIKWMSLIMRLYWKLFV